MHLHSITNDELLPNTFSSMIHTKPSSESAGVRINWARRKESEMRNGVKHKQLCVPLTHSAEKVLSQIIQRQKCTIICSRTEDMGLVAPFHHSRKIQKNGGTDSQIFDIES